MNVQFATCVRITALRYINKVYDCDVTEDIPEVKQLLDYVGMDWVRIQDPTMHGKNIGVIQGTKFIATPENTQKIIEISSAMHEKLISLSEHKG